MKSVDIIRPSSINAINGPIGTLKRIIKNKELFRSMGYDVTLFANESLQQGGFTELPESALTGNFKRTGGFRQQVSKWLRFQARKRAWAAKVIETKNRRVAERLIDYYISQERHPDIVQFHSDVDCYLYLKKRKDKRAKTVMFLHSDGIPFKMLLESLPGLQGSAYLEKLKKELTWTVENVDRIVFIAKAGQLNFLSYYPQRTTDDTSVIINGIDDLSDKQRQESRSIKANEYKVPYRLCCTGTISFRKGQRTIIEALSRLPESLRDQVHVDLLGDGAERASLEQYVAQQNLSRQVRFLGKVPNLDVYKVLAENNIYILMSKNEGLPISIIEAMRAGLPIISTKVSGIPELVDEGVNGFLLNPDVEELVDLLQRLPEYDWEQMGQNSRKRFEDEFTFERMEREFCEMYDKTLKS